MLRDEGIDAIHVAELGLQAADDRSVMRRAAADGRTLVSFDLDFAALKAADPLSEAGIILLRLPSARPTVVLPRLSAALQAQAPALAEGAVVIVEPSRMRVRRLPR